jgi:hypothetical protein
MVKKGISGSQCKDLGYDGSYRNLANNNKGCFKFVNSRRLRKKAVRSIYRTKKGSYFVIGKGGKRRYITKMVKRRGVQFTVGAHRRGERF